MEYCSEWRIHFIRNTATSGKIEPNTFSPINIVLLIIQKDEGLEVQENAAGEEKGRPQDQVQLSTGQQIYRETAVLL